MRIKGTLRPTNDHLYIIYPCYIELLEKTSRWTKNHTIIPIQHNTGWITDIQMVIWWVNYSFNLHAVTDGAWMRLFIWTHKWSKSIYLCRWRLLWQLQACWRCWPPALFSSWCSLSSRPPPWSAVGQTTLSVTLNTNQFGIQHYRYLPTHLREVSQYFWHLVTTFSAAYVDDDITVGVLGQGLRDDSLSTAKGSWDGCGSSLHTSSHREERRVQDGGNIFNMFSVKKGFKK